MPQKNKDFIKSNNIRRLIERSLKLWDAEKYKVLIQEVEMCDKKFWPHTTKMTEEQAIKVFTCFMLEGKTWAATYLLPKEMKVGHYVTRWRKGKLWWKYFIQTSG